MTKEEFQELLKRYRTGDCTLEEIETINKWFGKIADDNLELNEFEKARINDRMLSSIRKSLPSGRDEKTIRPVVPLVLKIAAGLLLTIMVGYFWFNRSHNLSPDQLAHIQSSVDRINKKNLTNDILKIQLPDSSSVALAPNAEISYSDKWSSEKREVYLVGEAFFDVVKDSKRPFYVYGGEIVTKVLGTSFSVNAAVDAESIEVSVTTGKVSVYEDNNMDDIVHHSVDATGVILTPNEKVKYFVTDKHWVTSLVEIPKPLPASNKAVDFVFNNAPLGEIKESIERTYSIDIIIENEASFSACTFTGDVSMMELYDLLEVICKSTGTAYEVKGTKILISGHGCQ